MSRWIAGLIVVATVFVFAAAQEGEKPLRFPFGGSKSQLPFDVLEQDGKTVWRVIGRGNIRVEELVAGYTTASGKRISYDSSVRDSAKTSVQYVGPDSGMIIAHDDLGNYVSELLEGARLTLVGHSGAKVRVVQIDDALGYAQVIRLDQLANFPESEWVTISWNNIDDAYGAAQQLLHFRTSRVHINGTRTNLTITGRVAQLRNCVKLIDDRQSQAIGSDGKQLRSYDLPGTVKAADAQRVLRELFLKPSTTVTRTDSDYRVTETGDRDVLVSVVSGKNRLLVRAAPADHELVKAAIAAMQ